MMIMIIMNDDNDNDDDDNDDDHFQAWLTKTESDIANEETPSSLAEAEKLLSQHQQIREEIDR